MIDLPAMEPCTAKGGRHELSAIVPNDDDRDLTLFCVRCGALRRLPVNGMVVPGLRLDDETADAIAEHVRHGGW